MTQHFLLSARARALRDDDMQLLGADEGLAYLYFMVMRWGSLTTQICPKCGAVDSHRPRIAHKQWRCNACRHDFSLKSGSLFEGTKLPYRVLLKAMWTWSCSSKGMSAVAMAKILGVNYEAAYLLLHKFRWALFSRSMDFRFQGEVEADVVWVFKHVRKFNDRSSATDMKFKKRWERKYAIRLMRRQPGLSRHKARRQANKKMASRPPRQNPKVRPLLSIAERGPDGKIQRSIGILLNSETFKEVEPIVSRFVAPGTRIYTDGAGAYKLLKNRYDTVHVDHEDQFSMGDGKHSNGVESGFAGWRRMEKGVYHRMNARTIQWFFAECAWRQEQRRAHPVKRFTDFVRCLLVAGPCRALKNYGTEQLDREQAPRTVRSKPVPLPTVSGLERLLGTGLLDGHMTREAEALREDLLPKPSFAMRAPAPRINSWDRRRSGPKASAAMVRIGCSALPLAANSPYRVSFSVA